MNTRRQFLIRAPIALATVAAACRNNEQAGAPATQSTPGAPVAFGTAPGVGPQVTPTTFAEAEKLLQVSMTPAEREMAASTWRKTMAPYVERRTGPRKVALAPEDAPASHWDPALPGLTGAPTRDRFLRSTGAVPPLPTSDADIAYAPVSVLSRWIEQKKLTSERLTNIYLERIAQHDGKLRSVIT